MRLLVLLVAFIVAVAVAANVEKRRVSWWWDAPRTVDDPSVSALLNWASTNSKVASSLLMRCGPSTATGKIAGSVLPSCIKVIPLLKDLGIESELWLGETDSLASAEQIFAHPADAVTALAALGTAYPGVTGFNFDFEISKALVCNITANVSMPCDTAYSEFLSFVRTGLAKVHKATGRGPWRVTADVSCHADGRGWAPMISNCSSIARGTDMIFNMGTYHGSSYSSWLSELAPALSPGIPRASIATGMACYNNSKCHPWELTPESAEQRVCMLMNLSFSEIGMFRVAPELGWPADWWLPQLQKFLGGGGCNV